MEFETFDEKEMDELINKANAEFREYHIVSKRCKVLASGRCPFGINEQAPRCNLCDSFAFQDHLRLLRKFGDKLYPGEVAHRYSDIRVMASYGIAINNFGFLGVEHDGLGDLPYKGRTGGWVEFYYSPNRTKLAHYRQ